MNSTIERLQARYDQLARADDIGFMRQLKTYLKTLDSERTVTPIIQALRRDVEDAAKVFHEADRELVREAVAIRTRLVADAPEIDDSKDPPPDGSRPGEYRQWQISSLRSFDEIASQSRDTGFSDLSFYGTHAGRTQSLIWILETRLYAAEYDFPPRGVTPTTKARNDLSGYEVEIANLQAKYTAAHRAFGQADQTLPGLAEQRLRLFVASLTPEPVLTDPDEDEVVALERSTKQVYEVVGARGVLRRAVTDGQTLQIPEQEVFDKVVGFLRGEADRLQEEVVDRLRLRERSFRRRAFKALGLGSRKVIAVSVLAIVGAIGTFTFAVAKDWILNDSKQPPSAPSTPHKKSP